MRKQLFHGPRNADKAPAFDRLHDNDLLAVADRRFMAQAGLENVVMVLSGMSDLAQLTDNIQYMREFRPLGKEETELLREAARILSSAATIPCTGCRYCTEGCPAHIAIPEYFSLFNNEQLSNKGGYSLQKQYYNTYSKKFGAASACIGCGKCERACPQHLPVRELLKKVAAHYEG